MGNCITKLNAYVLKIIDTFASLDKTTQDLFTNMFKYYGACTEKLLV